MPVGEHTSSRAEPVLCHAAVSIQLIHDTYRGRGIYWAKGSVCFGLKFCTPSHFSPSPLCGAISQRKQALNL